MSSWKTNVAVVVGTAGVIFGALSAIGPDQSTEERRRDSIQQQVTDLSDADQTAKDRMRERGSDGLHNERRDKLVPGEHRPPLRLRVP